MASAALILAGATVAYLLGTNGDARENEPTYLPLSKSHQQLEPARPNPLAVRAVENSVPGRYDNLPTLQSINRDPAYAADPGVVAKMQYAAQAAAPTYWDRQHALLEPTIDPLSLGALPEVRRGTGTQLPDPISGDDLKPQKRENRDVDMFMPMGQPLRNRYPFVHIDGQKRIEQLETKLQSGHGALDTFTHIPDTQGARAEFSITGSVDATRNFASPRIKN
jgi:hypothetical protein